MVIGHLQSNLHTCLLSNAHILRQCAGVTLNADNNLNHALYGPQANEKSILDGLCEPPQSPALSQLYAHLGQIMASAPDALLMFGSGAPGHAGQV